ncbi:MAG: DNA helicase RecQ [Bacteroidetes bacterium]|nr:DNA helicase RecQ [Bacteroidota bacterium]
MASSEILQKYFGYSHFRPMQHEIINAVLEKKDVMALMPTGGGKSVCFQIPAMAMEGTCLVISPLIALMKDQVEGLKANGIPADFLNSSQSPAEEDKVIQNCINGNIKLLYISPEKAITAVNGILKLLKISMIAIDEAHCVSQWGHDFRPEYTQLKKLRNKFPNIPLIALTATADKITRKDIAAQLGLIKPEVFISSFDRPNLSLEVRKGIRKTVKVNEIQSFIQKRSHSPGIIYCFSRKDTESISKELRGFGISSHHYHAGMPSQDRSKIQEAFINDELQVICATIAFGMGIDKSNVRWVIHYSMPKNIEGYYQEIGRSGRDGMAAETIMYYSIGDVVQQARFANQSGQKEINLEKLKRIQQFAEAAICRRKILLSYFGEILQENCGNCDVCKNPPVNFNGTIIAQKALSALARLYEKSGTTMLINVLRGSQNAELLSKGYDKIKTYGAGKEYSFDHWAQYLLQMLQLGLVEIAYDENSYLKITDYGMDVLQGKLPVYLVNPTVKTAENDEAPNLYPDGGLTNTSLFEELKTIRKRIAFEEKLPPYIIFHDKTLHEIAANIPLNKEEMLAIPGISETKFEKYCGEVLDYLQQNKDRYQKTKIFDLKDELNEEKLKTYVAQMTKAGITVSHHTLGKILLGSSRASVANAKALPFYGRLKNQTNYKIIKPPLASFITNLLGGNMGKDYFSLPVFNRLSQESREKLKNAIEALPIIKTDKDFTKFYILEIRKTYKRAYETWTEKEKYYLKLAVEHTNDLEFLGEAFQRPPSSLKTAWKKMKEMELMEGSMG